MTTVSDVARRAGVSVSTAARVLSGNGYASEATRRVVLEAAREIGYVPNHIARSLRTRRSRMIGLLIGDVENSFYSAIARNVESAAKTAGYQIVLCNSNDEPGAEREYLGLLQGLQVDGIIITPTSKNRAALQQLQGRGVAIVQVDRQVRGLAADFVGVNNALGAAIAVTHLLEAGHRRIGILTGPLHVQTGAQRLAGYRQVLETRGISVRPDLIRSGTFHRDHAIEDATALIGADPAPTAIFAANNILAEGCLQALQFVGRQVPQDVSVVAFDDTPWMRLVQPPITTIGLARCSSRMLSPPC